MKELTPAQKVQAQLEGYKELNAWGRMYAESYLLVDRVFVPLILGAPVAAFHYFEKNPRLRLTLLLGGILLLFFWIFRSAHAKAKRDAILALLNKIEGEDKLDFLGHQWVYDKTQKDGWIPQWLGDLWLKFWFFCIMLLVYLILIYMTLEC